MNNTLRSAAVMATLASAFVTGNAYANDYYAGLSRTTPGEAYVTFPSGQGAANTNHPKPWKLYGGMALNDRYGVEVGYGFFGTYRVNDPSPGSSDRFSAASKMLYVAGKASAPISTSFSLFGKFGLAANRVSTQFNAQPAGNNNFVRPMLGFGIEYKVTNRVSGVLEYDYYGSSRNFRQQKLELGVKVGF